jgi:hypothetical protein
MLKCTSKNYIFTIFRHSRESGNPVFTRLFWIPACAGMTILLISKGALKLLLILTFIITPVYAAQIIPRYQMENYNKNIEKLYKANIPTKDKIAQYSQSFLGKPYYLGALGEGPNGQFDKDPLYRTDKFDCMTFVSTVLALVESKNLREFQKNIKKIRYKNGKVSYLNRNHFASVDWNKNNIKNGYLKDITRRFPVAVAVANINKPMWYKKKADTIKYFTKLSPSQEKNY